MSHKFWETPLQWSSHEGLIRRSAMTRVGQYVIKTRPDDYLVAHIRPDGGRHVIGTAASKYEARQIAQDDYAREIVLVTPAHDALFYFDPASGTCPTLALETPSGSLDAVSWMLGSKALSLAPDAKRENLYLSIPREGRSGDYVHVRIDSTALDSGKPFGLFRPMYGSDGGTIGRPGDKWVSRREGWLFRVLAVEELARWAYQPPLAISPVEVGDLEMLPPHLPTQVVAAAGFTPIGF